MPRRQSPKEEDRWVQVTARIAELEDRVRILEARLREVSAAARKEPQPPPTAAQKEAARRAARARPRPRCPGCTLELPKGRRGDYCVWCGFMLTAVRARTFR